MRFNRYCEQEQAGDARIVWLLAPETLLEFEHIWHPEYQRYAEHVYNHLVNVPLSVLEQRDGKKLTEGTLGIRVQHLNRLGYSVLTAGFDVTVRNAIAHGTTVYSPDMIAYVDKKDRRELWAGSFGELFDTLVETCHGITVGILVWVARRWEEIDQASMLEQIPLGIRRLLVQGWAEYPGLRIKSVLESSLVNGSNQANVYCTTTTRSRLVHMVDAFNIACGLHHFGGSNYERILVHIDCGAGVPSLAVFRTDILAQIRRDGFSDSLMAQACDGTLLWHDSTAIRRRIWMWGNIARSGWEQVKGDVLADWRKNGFELWGSRYSIRSITGGSRRVNVEMVIGANEPITKHLLRGVMLHATRKLRWRICSSEPGTWEIPRFPSRICFRVHARDRPVRSLGVNGWRDESTVAQGEWRSWPRRSPPLWVKLPDEYFHGILIRYNPNQFFDEGKSAWSEHVDRIRGQKARSQNL